LLSLSIVPVAGYAVDGNTDGHFLNKSTTYTEYEHGAWWQVDLGSKKNINQYPSPELLLETDSSDQATEYAFAALKADGSITTWGSLNNGGTNASSAEVCFIRNTNLVVA
jgi:hypothetical protein